VGAFELIPLLRGKGGGREPSTEKKVNGLRKEGPIISSSILDKKRGTTRRKEDPAVRFLSGEEISSRTKKGFFEKDTTGKEKTSFTIANHPGKKKRKREFYSWG